MPAIRKSAFALSCQLSAIASALLLSACGGGSSSSSVATTEVSGSVFAAPVEGASVSVTDLAGNILAGPVISQADGHFTIAVPTSHLDNDLLFIARGGRFVDEATGMNTAHSLMKSRIAAASLAEDGSIGLTISPESTLIARLTDTYDVDFIEAQTRFEQAFGYHFDPHLLPVDATELNETASNEQRLAGLRAAAFSQLTQNLGLNPADQFDLLSLLADDLADGKLDGVSDTDTLSLNGMTLNAGIQTHFAQAFVAFKEGPRHASGLLDDQLGQLPFNRVAVTDSYIISYIPGQMSAMSGQEPQGKSSFRLQVTDLNGQEQTGLALSLSSMMYMQSHQHSTPAISVTEDPEQPGTYLATVYYLMPSVMMNGNSMGYWMLTVDIAGEQAQFFPQVGMAMGSDTVRANLKGQEDKAPNMMGMAESRPYYLFKHSLSQSGEATNFKVFIATRENMMHFPLLENGLILNAGTAQELIINSISVRMSTDEQNWVAAVYEQNGVWSADLGGLASNDSADIYVELTVNGEHKTDDGNPPDGIADNAIFSVTLPASDMM
jgi:hypothetical protein